MSLSPPTPPPSCADEPHVSRDEGDLFFTLSLDLLCVVGDDNRFRRVNPAFERVLGYSRQDLLSIQLQDLIHPDDVSRTTEARARCAGGARLTDFENRYRCKDGSYRHLLWTAVYHPERRAYYATARDITERKRAEELRQRSDARFRIMTDASPVGIFFSDGAGNCTYVNRAWQQIVGLSTEEAVGAGWRAAVHPEDRSRAVQAWNEAAGAGGVCRQTLRYVHADGAVRHCAVQAAPIFEDGVLAGHVGLIEDITARVELEQLRARAAAAVEEARDAAELANRAKSQFLANMSHEIRTHMTAILGFADLLDQEDLPAEQRLYVETIRRNGRHLVAIINDILDLSKIEAGQMSVEHLEFSPAQLLADVVDLVTPSARARGSTSGSSTRRRSRRRSAAIRHGCGRSWSTSSATRSSSPSAAASA